MSDDLLAHDLVGIANVIRNGEVSAEKMARLCIGLRGKAVGMLFVQLHSHPACSPMHGHFAAAYQEATRQEATRKGPGQVLPGVAAAVA